MLYEDVPDFYKILEVSRDAETSEIEEALKAYEEKMRRNLVLPHLMTSSRRALNEIAPLLKSTLLSGPEERKRYTQRLEAAESKSGQPLEATNELRLDDSFRSFFYFDLAHIDTEVPAKTLREMSMKLDREWMRTRHWLTHTTRAKHPLILFIKHNVLYTRLDNRIDEAIMQRLAQMNIDEAIERCLYLLNPEIERPLLSINKLLASCDHVPSVHLGEFLPDAVGPCTITLTNAGARGCLFGMVESLTDWMALAHAEPQKRFWLRSGINTSKRTTSLELPLFFNERRLARNKVHTAMLRFQIENYDPPLEIVVPLSLKILPLPPRVTFEPASTRSAPLLAKPTKRGVSTSVTITVRNSGDESVIPLEARLACSDPDVHMDPVIVHTNMSATITIETHNRAAGSTYHITVHVDYSRIRGARGTEEIYIQGEVLPTVWGSILRQKPLAQRALAALCGGLLGGLVGVAAAFITESSLLLGMGLLTLLLLWLMHFSTKIFVRHKERAGEANDISALVLWCVPLVVGILLALLDEISLITGTMIGGLIGCVVCFLADRAGPEISTATGLEQSAQGDVMGQSTAAGQDTERKASPRR